MPPQTTTAGQPFAQQQQQQPNGRKKPTTGRVVPAIPLALSKPKSSRPKAHVRLESNVSLDHSGQEISTDVARENGRSEIDLIHASNFPGVVQVETPTIPDKTTSDREMKDLSTADTTSPTPQDDTTIMAGGGASAGIEPSAISMIEHVTLRGTSSPTAPATVSAGAPAEQLELRNQPSVRHSTPHTTVPSMSTTRMYRHQNQGSTSSIVFGGQDSLNPSPVPHTGNSSFLPSVPSSTDSVQHSQWSSSNHNHQSSESYIQRPIGPPGVAPPAASWNLRQAYPSQHSHSPTHHPHTHQPFRYPPREVFTPTESQQQNGFRSRSASRTSVKATQRDTEELRSPGKGVDDTKLWHYESNNVYPTSLPMRSDNFSMPPPPHQLSPQADMWNLQALRSHVERYLLNQTYSDCMLYIEEGFAGGGFHGFHGHKILLSRSQRLLELISANEGATSGTKTTELHIRFEDRHVRLHPFLESLKFIYGGPLPQANPLRYAGFDTESMAVNTGRMEDALGYIGTGRWLKMPIIASRGVEVASCLLNWDTVTTALTFALDGGLSLTWSQFDHFSEDKSPSSSSEESPAHLMGPPKYDPYSTTFLQRIVHFIVQMLPSNFYLDSSAPQLEAVPRLPTLPLRHASRPSRSDPRLSNIRFGDVPAEDLQRPSFITTTSSSILLSLPFPILKFLLEHPDLTARLGPETVASIMRQVVAERELRRTKVMNAGSVSSNDGSDVQLMQNLHWAESVKLSTYHRAGFSLVRRKKDPDTPSSSGTESTKM